MTLRLKLTIWYSCVVSLTLIIFSVIVYTFLSYSLVQELDRELAGRAAGVASSVKVVGPNFWNQQRVVLPDVDVFGYPNTYLQVVDTTGRLVAKSSNLSRQTLPMSEDTITLSKQGHVFYEWLQAGDQRIRVYNYPLVAQNQVVGILQVGQPFSGLQAALNQLRWLLWLFSGGMILVGATIGWWLARAALKPVESITLTAEQIRQDLNLHQRIPKGEHQDELGYLVDTLNAMLDNLETAYRELSESHTAQRRFVSDVSHELKTPLTTIRGNIDLMIRMGEEQPEVRREALLDIASEVKRMSRLVSDMLVLARADAGFTIPLQPVAVDQVLEQVARQVRMLSEEVDFHLHVAETCRGVRIMADPDYLRQLLLILLDNAIKYTSPQGWVELAAHCTDGRIDVQVSDNGLGIDEGEINHIFERFYRLDKSRPTGGTGLGLAIASWITQQHGAKLTVKSQLHQGSVFTVTFPTVREQLIEEKIQQAEGSSVQT